MPRRRPKPRRVIVPVLVLAVLAAAVAILEAAESPSWLAWLPAWLSGGIAAALAVAVASWAEPWAARRRDESAREKKAVDRLRAHLGRQENLARVREIDPLALRVHPAIPLPDTGADAGAARQDPPLSLRRRLRWLIRWRTAPDRGGTLDPRMPTWIDREKAAEVRRWLQDAASTGGFLLVVGDSSVGKTRLLYEAVRRELPDWAILTPDLDDGDLVNTVAEATFGLPKLVVWLDELQRFLPGPYLNQTPNGTAVSAASLRRLLDAPTPVIVVGTLWPEHARELRSTETDPTTRQQRPRHPGAADILDDRRRHELTLETFSERERQDAAARAGEDPRLAEALAVRDYNVTEVLAGAPRLIRRYKQASPEEKAVLYAAIDARRLGIQGPLTEPLLAAAARGYLTAIHPDDTWFGPALTELIRTPAATPPLIPVPDTAHRATLGYTVTDYLLQYGQRDRRSARLPPRVWEALLVHTTYYGDISRLAESADRRLLYCYAIPLYRRAADAGDWLAADRLAELLVKQDRIAELRSRADASDESAAARLADLLAEQGNVEELRTRADADDRYAAAQLADLLVKHDRIAELRSRADAGDEFAATRLAGLLVDQGDTAGAIEVLRSRADAGDPVALHRLAELLAERGDAPGAIEVLRARADAGDIFAAGRLAVLLAEQGNVDELRARADGGDTPAAEGLANLLIGQGDTPGAIEVLRARADAGDTFTAAWLADLLAHRGDIAGLQARADAGDSFAARRLGVLLADRLAEEGKVEELRARADVGDEFAAARLADLLVERGDAPGAIEVLRARADAGDEFAAARLAVLLAEQGNVDELRARADVGDTSAGRRLADLLVERSDIDGLRAQVDAGDPFATGRLSALLEKVGRPVEAERLRRFGLASDGTIATRPTEID